MRLETIRTVCAELGISRATVYRLVQELNLQTYKRRGDRETYVDIDAIQEARQFQPQRPTAAPPVTAGSPVPDMTITADLKPLAGAIIVRGDRALLTERRFPGFGEQWSWPSGQIESGESLEEAILRELHEELMIEEAHVVGFLGDIDLPSGFRMSHFHVTIPDDAEPKLNDYEQLVRFEWMTRAGTEKAFKSLHPSIASRALEYLDQVLAGTKAQAEASVKKR